MAGCSGFNAVERQNRSNGRMSMSRFEFEKLDVEA